MEWTSRALDHANSPKQEDGIGSLAIACISAKCHQSCEGVQPVDKREDLKIFYLERLLGAANAGSFQRPPGGELAVTNRMLDGSCKL